MPNGGHSTTTIARPKDATAARTRPVDRPEDDTLLGDFTRPIAKDKQLVRGRGKRLFVGLGALVVVAAIVAALFVLPVQAWLRQEDDIALRNLPLPELAVHENHAAPQPPVRGQHGPDDVVRERAAAAEQPDLGAARERLQPASHSLEHPVKFRRAV